MSTHNICFRGKIRKICGYPLLSVAMVPVRQIPVRQIQFLSPKESVQQTVCSFVKVYSPINPLGSC